MDQYGAASRPIYIQIADSLLAQIEAGTLAPGAKLPSERTLSSQLNVTRMTLRQALQMLESDGILTRRQGAGTFVTEAKVERRADQLSPFTKDMQQRGLQPGAQVLLFETRFADVAVARKLQLAISAPVYYVQRLRFINQAPTMLESFWLPAQRFPDLEDHELTDHSVYEILESVYDVQICRAEQSLEAVSATAKQAELLALKLGSPLLQEERLAFDQEDRPVEYAKDLYRGDRIRFVANTSRADTDKIDKD